PVAEGAESEHAWPDDFLIGERARGQECVCGGQPAIRGARQPQRRSRHCASPSAPARRVATLGFAGSIWLARSYWARASRNRCARRHGPQSQRKRQAFREAPLLDGMPDGARRGQKRIELAAPSEIANGRAKSRG